MQANYKTIQVKIKGSCGSQHGFGVAYSNIPGHGFTRQRAIEIAMRQLGQIIATGMFKLVMIFDSDDGTIILSGEEEEPL